MSNDAAYTDEEVEQRMSEAVRRALNTPPQPHTAKPVKEPTRQRRPKKDEANEKAPQ